MLPVLDISCQVVLQNAEKNALELNQAQIGTDALLLTLLTVARKRWMKTYFQLCVCVSSRITTTTTTTTTTPPPSRREGIHLHINIHVYTRIHENNMIYIHLLTSSYIQRWYPIYVSRVFMHIFLHSTSIFYSRKFLDDDHY